MNNCKTYIATPQIPDPCNGTRVDAGCVIDTNAYIDLGISSNSSQEDINQASYNAIQSVKTTTDELQIQIDDLLDGYIFKGAANVNTMPETLEVNNFYLASQAGIYTNFDNIEVFDGELAAIFSGESEWFKQTIYNPFNKVLGEISAGVGWKITPLNSSSRITIVPTIFQAVGFLKIEGTWLVSNFVGGYYFLQDAYFDFTAGNDVFYLSTSDTGYVPLNSKNPNIAGDEVFIRTAPLSLTREVETVVIGVTFAGSGWDSDFQAFKTNHRHLEYIIGANLPNYVDVKSNEDATVSISVKNRIPVFSKDTYGLFYWLDPQDITVGNGDFLVLTNALTGIDLGVFNTEIPTQTYVKLAVVNYSAFNPKVFNAVVAFNWGGTINSLSECLKVKTNFDISKLQYDEYINRDAVTRQIKPFLEQVYNLTDNDRPLDVAIIGDSINNFQHLGDASTWKLDRTVEPQSLYGNTLGRLLWRKLNYTFSNRGADSVADNFPDTKPAEWGNLRFLRADHASVTKFGEFIPHGTRQSDNARIYWQQREYIGVGSTALGGFRGVLPDSELISTSIGNIQTHNRVYFFNETLNSYLQYSIQKEAKGFSLVFWGDTETFPYPQIGGGAWSYLSKQLEVKVDGVTIDNIDLTTYKGQSRKDYDLVNTGSNFTIRITNKDGKLMNLWGLEYWLGKSVRVTNYALAGNPAAAFTSGDGADFWINNKKADFYFWQMTNLNNADGYNETAAHKLLGENLKAKGKPLMVVNCHPPTESNPTTTNYEDLATPSKVWQHPDVYAGNKALNLIDLSYIDMFGLFKIIGEEYGYTGAYSDLLIDTAHLGLKGAEIYKKAVLKIIQ